MVKYVCPKCKKVFYKKYNYDVHINRKNSCIDNDDNGNISEDFSCKICDKKLSRPDKLYSHMKSIHNITDIQLIKKIQKISSKDPYIKTNKSINKMIDESINKTIDSSINKTIDKSNNVTNINITNNNNNNNNYYGMFPFGKDGTECLTLAEKIQIFSSRASPLETLVVLVNLNKDKPDHHNVGIPDMKSGYGIIYDGTEWNAEKISEIVNVLIKNKGEDLTKIREEIKEYVKEEVMKQIEQQLMDYIKMETDPSARKLLTGYLKKILYNYREFAMNAKKHMENDPVKRNINDYASSRDILKDGLTMDDIIKHDAIKKNLNNYKQLIRYILNTHIRFTNDDDHKYLIDKLDEINDSKLLNILFSVVVECIYFREKTSDDKFNQKININSAIDQYINNHRRN